MKHPFIILLSATVSFLLASCSPEKSPPQASTSGYGLGTATGGTSGDRYGSMARNPDMELTGNFSRSSGVTFNRVSVPGPYVALTFDDGPHASHTPRLLNILRARNVKATFYVIGKNVDLYPGIVRRTIAEGHEIGNHTYTHPKLSALTNDRVLSELRKTEDSIVRACGVRPRTMRPPYGALTQTQRQMVHATMGYPTIMWSVDPLDWKRPGAGVVTSRIVNATNQGAIILVHDIHAASVDAMPATIDALLRKGYRFVTVSQLIAMGQSSQAAALADEFHLAQSHR